MSRDYNYEHIRGVIHRRGREDIFSTAFSSPLRKDVSVLHERVKTKRTSEERCRVYVQRPKIPIFRSDMVRWNCTFPLFSGRLTDQLLDEKMQRDYVSLLRRRNGNLFNVRNNAIKVEMRTGCESRLFCRLFNRSLKNNAPIPKFRAHAYRFQDRRSTTEDRFHMTDCTTTRPAQRTPISLKREIRIGRM